MPNSMWNALTCLNIFAVASLQAGLTEPVETGSETVGTGSDRFRFRPVPQPVQIQNLNFNSKNEKAS
jgi:hypothetical protein